jgi:DNA invertase Pin-like site-specific DNA recombinase
VAKPVAAYLRVSTDDQSHASQRLEVERWLAREGIDPERVRWYTDTESGRKIRRAQLDVLRSDVRTGAIKTVVVFALDRLSRDFFDGVSLLGELLKKGCRVASATEALDLSGELGHALAGVIFALGQAEHRKRRERQKAGIELAKARGAYAGRRKGTRKGSALRAAELRARGLKLDEIAASLRVTTRTVIRYLGQGSAS